MKKILFAIIACAFGCLTANAQSDDTVGYPHGFVGIRGGAHSLFLQKNDGDRKITPAAGISLGYMFNPYLGARADFQGVWNKFEAGNAVYDLKSLTSEADLMLNLTNCFRADKNKPFNLYLIGGIGANKVWGSNYKDLANYPTKELGSKIHNHVTHACRLGLAMDVNLAPAWALNLEVDANHFGNHDYAHLVNASKDWQLLAQLGVKYRFGQCKPAKPAPVVPAPVVPVETPKEEPAPAPAPVVAPAPVEKPAPVVKQLEKMRKEVFYLCAVSDAKDENAKKIEEAAAWPNAHPTAKASVDGYADKGTGNARINKRYARERAQKVKDALVAAGVKEDRLTVKSYGDTVQPFAENDLNRCVIIVAEEK